MTKEKEEPPVWGRPLKSKKVHLYLNGEMACNCQGGNITHISGKISFKDWNIDNQKTCPKCRAWARIIQDGLTVVKPVRNTS